MICEDQSLLARLAANQRRKHKQLQQTLIRLGERVDTSSKPGVINKMVSMRLNQANLSFRVNMHVNTRQLWCSQCFLRQASDF